MITLRYVNGFVYVWSSEDWLLLRKNRIVGSFIGHLANLPRQESFPGLPLALMPEEVALLLEKSICTLKSFSGILSHVEHNLAKKHQEFEEKNKDEQKEVLKQARIKEIQETAELIVKGKRAKVEGLKLKRKERRNLRRNTNNVAESPPGGSDLDQFDEDSKTKFIEEEVQKIKPLEDRYLGVQTFTGDPWIADEDGEVVDWRYPSTQKEKLNYRIFKNLWEKGYYITKGTKFGADYLVYPGDPTKYHSQFIVMCMDPGEKFNPLHLVTYGRLGQSVRKTVVLGYLDELESISYQSIQWAGI